MRLVRAWKAIFTLMAAALAAFILYAVRSEPVFEAGKGYEFYLGTSSSEIVCTETPALSKLFLPQVKGESVRYEGERFKELQEKFDAQLLFVEEAGGVTNYYLHSPKLGSGVLLEGEEVNLHIAVGNGQTAAGTPLIFGGF